MNNIFYIGMQVKSMKNTKNKNIAKLSKLDYAVMAILHNCELSGYDITNRLKHFWKTSHSRIYPTLAKLEGFGLLKHVDVKQTDRPDKKVYRLTPKALEEIKLWILNTEDKSYKIVQDEELLKLLCSDVITKDELLTIAKKRMQIINQTQENLNKMLENITHEKKDLSSELIAEIVAFLSTCDSYAYNWMQENVGKHLKDRERLKDYIKRNW